MQRRIRAIKPHEYDAVINYFLDADQSFLQGMGVLKNKLPTAESWRRLIAAEYAKPIEEREHYYVIWELDGLPVGHCNINQITFGQEAQMHLHLWRPQSRGRGHGSFFVKASVTHFFQEFHLQKLYCQPYAHNPAPNRTMAKLGFDLLEKAYFAPGWLSFPQDVNRWVMTRKKWFA